LTNKVYYAGTKAIPEDENEDEEEDDYRNILFRPEIPHN